MSLDLDIAVATEDLALRPRSCCEGTFGSSVPAQRQRLVARFRPAGSAADGYRYASFVGGASLRDVLGISLPVARVEDVLQGKVWAAQDPARRPSKRQKDLADISRLLEGYPGLRSGVPGDVLSRLI